MRGWAGKLKAGAKRQNSRAVLQSQKEKKKKKPFKSWLRGRAQENTSGFQLRIHVGSLQDTAEQNINEMEDKSVENIDW